MSRQNIVPCLPRVGVVCAAWAVLLFAATASHAATIEIEFTGMDLAYNGVDYRDAGSSNGGLFNPADADPLTSLDFYIDGSPVGSLSSDISLDMRITGIPALPSAPGTVVTQPATAGFFDLLIGTSPFASEFLALNLQQVSVTYVDLTTARFTLAAAVGGVLAQNLPFNLEVGDSVAVSFSANLVDGTVTSAGGFLTGFLASGTGEIRGDLVPEPTAMLLALCGTVLAGGLLRR